MVIAGYLGEAARRIAGVKLKGESLPPFRAKNARRLENQDTLVTAELTRGKISFHYCKNSCSGGSAFQLFSL